MDLIYLAAIAVFGAVIGGFIVGCDRLAGRAPKPRAPNSAEVAR